MVSNRNLLFQGVIFRCLLSFREGTNYPKYPDPSKAWRHFEDQNTPTKYSFIQPKPLEGPIADP